MTGHAGRLSNACGHRTRTVLVVNDDTERDATPDTTPDTSIREPSVTAGEVEMLLFALDRSRAQFAWKCGGLDAAGLNRSHPPSTMTLGGLLKHVAFVLDYYTWRDLGGDPPGAPWDTVDLRTDPGWVWRSAADDAPEELYSLWSGAERRFRATLTGILANGGVDQPTAFTLSNGESRNLRRLLVDLHDEYARHVGHADLLREAVDGLVGEDPPQP